MIPLLRIIAPGRVQYFLSAWMGIGHHVDAGKDGLDAPSTTLVLGVATQDVTATNPPHQGREIALSPG